MPAPPQLLSHNRAVIAWLICVIGLVFCMVVVGGITRITESGLSIVEWAPVVGALPPITDADWLLAFQQYQQSPQYRLVNTGMSMDDFKFIFFWEWFHRLLARFVGLAFGLPFIWFALKGAFNPALRNRLLVALILGGSQGAIGWFMVMSGLVDEPRVSHFRLALHLGMAFIIISYLGWIVLGLLRPERRAQPERQVLALLKWITGLMILQIVYGAFVAGMRAGWLFGTFPKMGDQWFGVGITELSPWLLNTVENPVMVQFIHRWLGVAVLLLVFVYWLLVRRYELTNDLRNSAYALFGLVCVQFLLGVHTLIHAVPLVPAVAHQATASLIVLSLVYCWVARYRQPLSVEAGRLAGAV